MAYSNYLIMHFIQNSDTVRSKYRMEHAARAEQNPCHESAGSSYNFVRLS
jgi:hypothetical protein